MLQYSKKEHVGENNNLLIPQPGGGSSAIQLQDNRSHTARRKKQVETMTRNATVQIKRNTDISVAGKKGKPGLQNHSDVAPVQLVRRKAKAKLANASSVLGGLALATGLLAGSPATAAIGTLGLIAGLGYKAYRKYARGTAEQKIARAEARGRARKQRERFPVGNYDTAAGIVGISGLNKQRIAQTNMANYHGESLGRMPEYSEMQKEIQPEDVRHIYDPSVKASPGMTDRRKIGIAVSIAASNVSEEDKAPGIGKMIRAFARKYVKTGKGSHPLSSAINPAVTSADNARHFMSGKLKPIAEQREAIDGYLSESSDEDEPHFALRSGLLKPHQE